MARPTDRSAATKTRAAASDAATDGAGDAIHLRGIPMSLAGVLPDGASETGDLAITIRGYPSDHDTLDVAVQRDVDPRIIRATVPVETPPGAYQGTLTGGASERAVVLDVEPSPSLRVVPEQMRIDAKPGETVHRTLNVLNGGNVPVPMRRVQAFGVFMAGGVERALRRGYVRTLAKDQRRVDVIADNLADAHGGLVRMTITSGADSIAPGALEPLEVDVKIPTGLTAGAVYGGNWELPGLVYPVVITVPGEPPDVASDIESTPGVVK
jgi:hypothetical protein